MKRMQFQLILFCCLISTCISLSRFNQTSGFNIEVSFNGWSNFGENGGCVTCPYTCVRPTTGPSGTSLNYSNSTQISSLPAKYTQPQMNGCCFASKQKSKKMPSCQDEADPPKAEDCGFLYGPSLKWKIDSIVPPEDAMRAVLFASIDCVNFWAVGETQVKEGLSSSSSSLIEGMKQINGGCYGVPTGGPIVLSGCLTNTLKFDKSAGYTWDMLAQKCMGLSGKCTRTNALWGRNLKCCTDGASIDKSDWDLVNFETYTKDIDTSAPLSGIAVTGIVFGGVAMLLCLVHYGKKIHERARHTALMREQEASDDYEEIVTPLNGDNHISTVSMSGRRMNDNLSLDISLHEGDKIFRKREDEVLYEGDLH